MSKKVYIYGLYDPRNQQLRYIGKTNNLTKRLWYHLRDARGGQRTHKGAWIRQLLSEGLKPMIAELGETTENSWQEDEREWIARALADGVNLTNLTEGGDGLIGYNHSEETKQKISAYNIKAGKIPPSWKGRKQSPEHTQKRVEARKKAGSYAHTEESKENISKGRKGKNVGHTYNVGFKHTEESKQKRARASKGEKNHFFGRKHTEESLQKMREGRKGKGKGNKNASKKQPIIYP